MSFDWVAAATALGGSLLVGYVVTQIAVPVVHDRYFPWIVARACGLAAYVALLVLVGSGMWLRHPWRSRFSWPHAETQLRLHAVVGTASVLLLVGHMVSLALDRWAGVGWLGTVVPLKASYRPGAVAVGVITFYALVALVVTARFGGRIVGRHWLTVHRLALPMLAAVWFHGVLAGTDTPRLRLFYAVTGLFVVGLALTRWFGQPYAVRRLMKTHRHRASAGAR